MAWLRCLLSKPQIAGKVASNGFAIWGGKPSSLFPAATSSIISTPPQHNIIDCNNTNNNHHQQTIIRWKVTKTKKRQKLKMIEREKRVARGLPAKHKPPKYISKDTPVINAMTREERDEESKKFDALAAEDMKVKIAEQSKKVENLRFHFDGLEMSDRVRKLFELNNGSQREVITSQKRRGMEVSYCSFEVMLYIMAY